MPLGTSPAEFSIGVHVLDGQAFATFRQCCPLADLDTQSFWAFNFHCALRAPTACSNVVRGCLPLMSSGTPPPQLSSPMNITFRQAMASTRSRYFLEQLICGFRSQFAGAAWTPTALLDAARNSIPFMPLGTPPPQLGEVVYVEVRQAFPVAFLRQ